MKLQFGLRSKLVVMIAVIIGFIFLVQVAFQAFWLEDFYLRGLARGVEQDLVDAETQLKSIPLSNADEFQKTLANLRLQMDHPLLISSNKNVDFTYESNLTGGSFIAFKPAGSTLTYNIPVEPEVVEAVASNSDFQNGTMYIEGYLNTDLGELIPSQIKMEGIEYNADEIVDYPNWYLEDDSLSYVDEENLKDDLIVNAMDSNWTFYSAEGTLSYFQLGSIYNDDYTYSENLLFDQVLSLSSGKLGPLDTDHFESIQIFDDYNQTNNLIIYKQLDLEDTNGLDTDERLYIFSIISFASIQEPLAIYQEYNWITMLTGTVFAILLVILFTGRMVKPIKEMERVTSNMAQLNFDERLEVSSTDEIGQLATSFNVLSDKLQHSISNMQTLNYELELEVEERVKQQKVLKEFIGNASHELKTPITIMKGLLDGVEDGIYDANSNAHQDSVKDEVLRMEKIVYDLLQVSKMERGALQVHTSIFDPSDIIYSTYQRHKARGAEKNMTFHFDFEDTFVEADAQLIESVIDNLIGNAINYSDEGADIHCEIISFQKQTLISIENTLAQIPEEDLPNIFDSFYRVDKSHTRMTGGSGLGLSIIKNILDLHDSKFELHNTKDGVKFTFSLKCISDE